MWTCMPPAARVTAVAVMALLTACMSAEMPGHAASQSATARTDADADATLPLPQRLVARGTEPFWAIEIDGDRLLWKTPAQPEGRALLVTRQAGPRGAHYAGRDGATELALEVTVARCSDGMSDLVYPYTAVWTYGAATLSGCALPPD